MLRPTIYIPSRLTRLLAPLALPQLQVLPVLAGLLGPGDSRRPSNADRGRGERRGLCRRFTSIAGQSA